MPTPGEHKTVQARILAYAEAIFAETDDLNRVTAMVDELFTLLEKADRI